MAATAANVAAATATGRLTRSSSSLGTMVAGRRRPRSPRSSAGGGTSRSGHPSGIRFGWRDNHAATSRRLSQLVYIAALANSWFVSGSRRGPRPRQKVSMASRSYVLPLPATNTGSRIIAFVMGQRSSSGSSSPGGASGRPPSRRRPSRRRPRQLALAARFSGRGDRRPAHQPRAPNARPMGHALRTSSSKSARDRRRTTRARPVTRRDAREREVPSVPSTTTHPHGARSVGRTVVVKSQNPRDENQGRRTPETSVTGTGTTPSFTGVRDRRRRRGAPVFSSRRSSRQHHKS